MGSPTHKRTPVWLLLLPFLLVYGALVVIPVAGVVLKSFSSARTLELEFLSWSKLSGVLWTLDNYTRLLETEYYRQAAWNTVVISGVSVIVSILIGTPLAYLLAFHKFRGKGFIEWVISLPIYLPGVVAAYAVFLILNRQGLFPTITRALFGEPVYLLRTVPGVVLGTIYIILPMFLRIARTGFERIRRDVFEASLTLGASELRAFRDIMLPQALPAIGAGAAVTFTYAMGLVVVILILGSGGATFSTLPLEIIAVTNSVSRDIPLASAMAVLLLLISAAGQWVSDWLLKATGGTD